MNNAKTYCSMDAAGISRLHPLKQAEAIEAILSANAKLKKDLASAKRKIKKLGN